MSDTGIDVYIPEPGGGAKDSEAFGKGLQAEFGVPFEFVSIGRGAAAAAWVAELISFAQSPTGIAIGAIFGVFFAGEKLEKNLDAWAKLFQRLKATFDRRPTFDREGAAVLFTNEITQLLGEEPVSLRCNGFRVWDRFSDGNPMEILEPMPLDSIGPRQDDKVSNRDVYYFDVEVNNRRFLGCVAIDQIKIKEIK